MRTRNCQTGPRRDGDISKLPWAASEGPGDPRPCLSSGSSGLSAWSVLGDAGWAPCAFPDDSCPPRPLCVFFPGNSKVFSLPLVSDLDSAWFRADFFVSVHGTECALQTCVTPFRSLGAASVLCPAPSCLRLRAFCVPRPDGAHEVLTLSAAPRRQVFPGPVASLCFRPIRFCSSVRSPFFPPPRLACCWSRWG